MFHSNSTRGGRPNVLLVVFDDMGYSDCEPFGGEIRTPNLQKLADAGVCLRNFHTSSLCAPTRSMLLSGVDNHQNGMGVMPPLHSTNQYMQPGYEGMLNHNVVTIAEVLRDGGYRTYMTGKWHLGSNDGYRPLQRGFEKAFAFLGGGVSHFNDARALSASEQPHTRYYDEDRDVTYDLPDAFYSSTFYADRMIKYLGEQDGDAPFFAYLAFTAPHDPLHVPPEWLDKYKGRYDEGYDAIRKPRLARMKDLGLIAEDVADNPGSGLFSTWSELSDEDRKEQARRMELYAAMIENADHELGRVLDKIRELGVFENTLVFATSDNGANPKEPQAYVSRNQEQDAVDFDNRWENLGRKGSFVSLGGAWAEVANTPLSHFKTTVHEGGTQTPLIIAGTGLSRRGVVLDQMLHAADVLPTLMDVTGVQRPREYKGAKLLPLYGVSWWPFLAGQTQQPIRNSFATLGFEMIECRAIIKGDWKLIFTAPPYGENEWQLHNLREDPTEKNDVAEKEPEKLAEMMHEWQAYAISVGYIEAGQTRQLETMTPEEFYRFEKPPACMSPEKHGRDRQR